MFVQRVRGEEEVTPARAQELAAELGLDAPPTPRYDDVPEANTETRFSPKFHKALQLVDQIETWAFERFIPDSCVIDPNIDARAAGDPELHFAVCVRTDRPPPSNDLIHRSTGIKPDDMSKGNFYQWLAVEVARMFTETGAVAMGVPLIFRTKGKRDIVPFVGAICKFDRTPPDGQKMHDQMANVGVLIPAGTRAKNRVIAKLETE